MCGIAGIIGAIDPLDAENKVKKMVKVLARRGPDSQGIEKLDGAVLGHRRLAIFDLSDAGRQPMISPDRSVAVVFNGAIYNFRDLRKELIDLGYSFGSNTDTEILLHGYREWGIDRLVSKLTGMFAFGLWDGSRRKLFLVRDRLGEKPLIFATRNRQIAFASTVTPLREAGFVDEIDEDAIGDFLAFGFVTDQRSIYRRATKVPAGSMIEWSDGRMLQRQYWTPAINKRSPGPSFQEAVEETEHLILRSVKERLYADVPVGVTLSGGIDSALVCWAIKKLGSDITAYTVGTPGDPWDETNDAVATARSLGIQHRILEMSGEIGPEIDELVSAYAEPFACSSALGMLIVSRAMAQSVKVVLTGDGGDDLYLGYPEHRHFWLAQKLSSTLPLPLAKFWPLSRPLIPEIGMLRRASAFLDYATVGLTAIADRQASLSAYTSGNLLGDRLSNRCFANPTVTFRSDGGRRVLDDFLQYHLKTRFVGEYLTKVDGATMYHALEARSPFLDHRLWEFASALPFELLLCGGSLKAILRALVSQRISKQVAIRSKKGFGIPVHRWIVGRWRPQVESLFRNSILEKEGWLNSNATLRLLAGSVQNGSAPLQLWYLFVLESWMQHQSESIS
jgi:asparagine synthase (glutamine-hydrolysing)